MYFKITAVLSVSFLCLFSQGCGKDQARLEKRVLAHDPSFQETLDRRNSLREELDSQAKVFHRKTKEIKSQIDALARKKTRVKREYSSSVEKIKQQIHPERKRLQKDLLDAQRRYEQKKQEIRDVRGDIKEISALIKKKDVLALTQEEMRTWNDRLSSLMEKKEALNSEKDKLRTEIEITKLKRSVLVL